MEHLIILAIVAVFAIVQSVFGLGLLVFGTPTLLLMGYDFYYVLGALLPASCAISILQIRAGRPEGLTISPHLYWLCVPGIFLGLAGTGLEDVAVLTKYLVGVMLLFVAISRLSPRLREMLGVIIKRYSAIYHAVMGCVHGLTNLGGALLAILASSETTEKKATRYMVAYYYLIFSTIQMGILIFLFGRQDDLIAGLPNAIVAIVIFLSVGNRAYKAATNALYAKLLSVFAACYGLTVIINMAVFS